MTCKRHEIRKMSVTELAHKVFGKCSDPKRFIENCGLDMKTGESAEVKVCDFPSLGISIFGNGAGWARDDGSIGKIFKIKRTIDKGRIVSVRLVGYALKSPKHTRQIPESINRYYADRRRMGY